MITYAASNGAIVADLTALRAILSTNLPTSGFVVLLVAAENSWFEYNPALTSGDVTPTNNPANGRWIRIGRDKLTANRTYFVRTDGDNNNNGLANTSGGAFLTIQKAIDVAATLDLNGFNLKIKAANGTYTTPIVLKEITGYSGAGSLIIEGDTTSFVNVILSVTNNNCISAKNISSVWDIQGFKLQTTTSGSGISVNDASLRYGSIDFGVCASVHIALETGSKLECISNYSISGNSAFHFYINANSVLLCFSKTITLVSTIAFTAFFRCGLSAAATVALTTFVGTATGTRYTILTNGAVDTGGGGANYFPGNIAGTLATGGQYV